MKVIILAGGFGTRLSEYTDTLPKPMVRIGGKPILWHIMKTFAHFGHIDFYVALGYKAELIKEYFLHYRTLNADFTVDLGTGIVNSHQLDEVDWKVTLVNTGQHSMTGGRVKRMKPYIGNETCLLTYGDGANRHRECGARQQDESRDKQDYEGEQGVRTERGEGEDAGRYGSQESCKEKKGF